MREFPERTWTRVCGTSACAEVFTDTYGDDERRVYFLRSSVDPDRVILLGAREFEEFVAAVKKW